MALGFRLTTHERYVAREIYGATALVLIAFLLLFGFFDLLHEFESLGNGGYQIHHAIIFVALTLPARAYELLPIAVLIGALYALTVLARHSEMTVLRASGTSTVDWLRTLAKVGLVFVVLTFVIGDFVVPPTERFSQQLRLKAMAKLVAAQEFRSGLWVKDDHAFMNVREISPEAELKGIRIYQFDKQYRLDSISEAESGTFTAPDQWYFRNVTQTVFDESGDGARVDRLPELRWKSALNPDILAVLLVNPDRMSVDKLYRYIRHLQANQQQTDRYEIALWKKIIYPLACIVMLFLALPFGYLQDRAGAVSVKVFAGIMLGVLFNMLNGLFSNLGIINHWAPFFSAIVPSVIFLGAAGGMLWMTEKR